jgi:hypothetical protein
MGIGAVGAFLLLRNPYNLISGSRESDWQPPVQGRLSYVFGDVFINGTAASEGDLVSEGDVIKTGPESAADVEIQDVSIFHIKENTEILVENVLASPKIKVRKGWFLVIVKRDIPFEVDTPTVLAGVRGTVFFFKVYNENNVYLCDCNGKIELFDSFSGESLKLVKSHYHTAFDLNREGGAVTVQRAKLRYHEDDDILRMAGQFPNETRVFKEKQRGGSSYS